MQKSLPQRVHEYIKKNLRHKRWRRIVIAMACVVVFCTTYALILPAITMTDKAYCGKEEHTHTQKDCYERVLICGYDETETEAAEESTSGHTHTDACYETRKVLVCKEKESSGHTHDESCYDEAGNLTCGQTEDPGHTHDESCYQEERVLICGLEETESTESTSDHVHTDDCYEEQLVCQKEGHKHSLACYSNPDADVESASAWERTLPQKLGDNWAENVVAVAESQIGYTESTANYTVLEDGETMKGYTRYGAWYGTPYDDWDAMFASFCLHYAGVPKTSVPYASSCSQWVEQLQSAGLYESAEECFPEPGFLVFFDTDGDSSADHVGIVTEADGETISTVEGDIGGAVETRSYSEGDSTILGYCVLPQNPDTQEDEAVSENDIMLTSENSFQFTDSEKGLTVTLTLTSDNYSPSDYQLKVEYPTKDNYENALKTVTPFGQEVAEAAIYKIYLVHNQTQQSITNLNGSYTLKMQWENGLYTEVSESDELKYTYCKNAHSEPTEFSNCEDTKNSDGNVASVTISDDNYPNSAEFLFVRLKAADEVTAGQSKLVYNEVKDRFITDSAYDAYYNSNSPLGTAGSFHIVAFDTAKLNTHTNGDVLAKNLYANSNFGTNNLGAELSYVQNYVQVNPVSAADEKSILALGSDNTIEFADNKNAFSVNSRKIDRPHNLVQDRDSKTAPFIDLDRVEAEIAQISETLRGFQDANLTYTSASDLKKDNSQLKLNDPSAIGVVSYTAAELKNLGNYVRIGGFQKGYNGTVIINVDCTGAETINMPRATVVIDGNEQGTSEVTEFSAGKVIWNFVNASGVTINTNLMTGAVIAPGATVNIGQNLNGTVVAKNVNVNAESHRTDFTGKIEEPDETPESDEQYISVRKIKTGYAGTALSGAEFDLYQWKDIKWTKVNTTSLVTGSKGTVMLRNLTQDVAYKLVETKAPRKYLQTNEATYFWLRTNTSQTKPTQSPEDFAGQALDTGSTLQIANDQDTAYVLPETGGSGTFLFIIGGTLLLAGSLLFGYVLRRKRERRFIG